jgi:hypothetical protein
MFPGDPGRGIPAAAATGAVARIEGSFPGFGEVDALLRDVAPAEIAANPDGVIKALKAQAADLMDSFIEQAILAYFSDPAVSVALTGKPTPLFPNNTVMADIDYDLLEPVLTNCGGNVDD